jgi:hypothetical protein
VKRRAALAATLGITAWSLAAAQAPVSATSTLLVPRAKPGALEFVDPGSGLLLASVALDTAPRRVAVSPDGRLAAVLGCRIAASGAAGPVAVSIVDLEQPRERRRIELGARPCPSSLHWGTADRANRIIAAGDPAIVIDTDAGQVLSSDTVVDTAPDAGRSRQTGVADASSVAVQRVLAGGGRLEDLAVSPVIPRAVCHACTIEP